MLRKIAFAILMALNLTSLAYAENTKIPYMEFTKPAGSNSGNAYGVDFRTNTYKITTSSGVLIGDRGLSVNEAADIKVIGNANKIDFIERYRKALSVKGEATLIMKPNFEINERYNLSHGFHYSEESDYYFYYSNGYYHTDQGDLKKYWYDKTKVYDDDTAYSPENCGYGYYNTVFKGLENRGIPLITYLFRDSENTIKASQSNYLGETKEHILLNGREAYRYTYTYNENDKNRKDMYFFSPQGVFIMYAYEIRNSGVSNITGSPIPYVDWTIKVFDVVELVNKVKNKNVLNHPPVENDETNNEGFFSMGVD